MREIVLYSNDINLLMHWEKAMVKKRYKVVENYNELQKIENSLIIMNFEACQKECYSFLSLMSKQQNRILLLDRVPELQKAKKILKSGAMGYGNALMREHFILSAIDALQENMVWLYPELTSALIFELPVKEEEKKNEVLQKLTRREKEVALLLKDGLIYNEIAEKLQITNRTVKAHAKAIYSKLNLKDRLGLALLLK